MKYKNMLMYAGIALVVVVVLAVVWHFFINRNKSTANQIENFSSAEGDSGTDYQLLFFYANWCPHCKEAKPEWEKIKEALKDTQVNGKTIKTVDYDCTDPSPEMESIMDKYNVSSYPTVLLVSPTGQVTPFENKTTKDNVMNFLNNNVK